MSKSIAIVGAGMAGLSCAVALAQRGHRPVLFDKGRGPGGRMATRRVEIGGSETSFDHGAQYFTARDPRFRHAIEAWQSAGYVAPWPAAGEGALVGTPFMNAPLKQMAQFFNVQWGTKIDDVLHDIHTWHLKSGTTIFRAQQLVCAIPAEQAAELLAKEAPEFAAIAVQAPSQPCWALMARFAGEIPIADCFRGADVAWTARNSSKPGRSGGEDWVIHASPGWSAQHLELTPEEVAPLLLAAFFAETGAAPNQPVHAAAHRWRYAMAGRADGPPALWDADLELGVCGDWLIGPRVESAFLSGLELAGMIAD